MKHGQSSKTKPAKTSKKVSNKAAGKKPVAAKAGSKSKAAVKKEVPARSKKENSGRAVKQAPRRVSGAEKTGGKTKKVELSNTARNAAARAEGVVFTTAEVGAAYRRAVQKFGAALKRLSD